MAKTNSISSRGSRCSAFQSTETQVSKSFLRGPNLTPLINHMDVNCTLVYVNE
ncbi:hypothetical protein HanIR_Chr13g0654871 [Helianthus annuus]|nr:hypothetical protein HanIR_Chr13g0654871 [Helianthus annuus]